MNNILVIGTGELGHAIIRALHQHPKFESSIHSITTTVRKSTLSAITPGSSRDLQFKDYKTQNIAINTIDVENESHQSLVEAFRSFTTIIHAGGMTISAGTQLKITSAVLASAESAPVSTTTKLYIPWQFGLDYDTIGPNAGEGLFAEQCSVRTQLRSQTKVDWVIISNGVFTSFMFEPAWGVVEEATSGQTTVRALGSWENTLVATTAEDIARCTAELVLVDTDIRNRPVFVAGDSISYAQVADLVESRTHTFVNRELWTTEQLITKLDEEPTNMLRKYHVVFSQGVGANWPPSETYNAMKGIVMETVKDWFQRTRAEQLRPSRTEIRNINDL